MGPDLITLCEFEHGVEQRTGECRGEGVGVRGHI